MKLLSLQEIPDARHSNLTEWLATCETIFGRRIQYRGRCTVWHSFPDGKRAPTSVEAMLCDAAVAVEWGRSTK
jgi:hypothetical protein